MKDVGRAGYIKAVAAYGRKIFKLRKFHNLLSPPYKLIIPYKTYCVKACSTKNGDDILSKCSKANLFILFLTYLFACIGWQFINTVLISFGVEYIKVDTVAMASLGGSVAIISLLIRPVSGVITDRINTKLIYTASMFLLFVSYLGFAFCHDYFWLYFFQILRGFSWTFFNVA